MQEALRWVKESEYFHAMAKSHAFGKTKFKKELRKSWEMISKVT